MIESEAKESAHDRARSLLARVFGFAGFRPGQEEVIRAVLDGEDVLAVMPTGSGKSLCYQLPAITRTGLTVVVSPLISLMRDQVGQLRACGVEAASLTSANDGDENRRILAAIGEGELKILYVAPERLTRADMVAGLRRVRVGLLAIDEAHCVSQWGHDFRPEYLALGRVREALDQVQTIALTATADGPTRADIADKLFPKPPRTFVRSFDRPNLSLAMEPKANGRRQILDFLATRKDQSGIVYCSSRKRTESLAAVLAGAGYPAFPYHAGMDQAERDAHQDAFLRRDGIVMVATVAFGMGIDKPDVRFVCHADLPKTIESYYQEIGRAGRDGLAADTLTLYGLDDMRLRRLQIEEGDAPEDRKRIDRQRLNALVALCEAPRCRRQTLLAYFGEASGPCGNCDLCQDDIQIFDGTVEAQKVMSAILRTGERFGTEHLVNILTGEATDAIRRHRHDQLPTFGVGRDRTANAWRSIIRQAYAGGAIALDIVEHGRWTITDLGRQVLRGKARIEFRSDVLRPSDRARVKGQGSRTGEAVPADPHLLAALKALRLDLARRQGVPAYVVFPDRTLIEMAARSPSSLADMQSIHGVGAVKLATYGEAFLAVVKDHAPAPGAATRPATPSTAASPRASETGDDGPGGPAGPPARAVARTPT
jgi:ATP-dependent DNA helicase RecQ